MFRLIGGAGLQPSIPGILPYLTRHKDYDPRKHSITIIEASRIAGRGSGKAGGLLAVSAHASNIKTWGYRRVPRGNHEATGRERSELERLGAQTRVSLVKRRGGKSRVSELAKDLAWVMPNLVIIHPYQFTMSVVTLAQEQGVNVIIVSVTNIEYSRYTESSPTPPRATRPPSDHLTPNGVPTATLPYHLSHSVTTTPSSLVSAYPPFTEITIPATPQSSPHNRQPSNTVSPEIDGRPNNEISAVPERTADVQIEEDRCDDLIARWRVTHKEACYLPLLNVDGSGCRLIGETGTEGSLMARGHSCWGIDNATAMGKLLSDAVFEGQVMSADARQLDPRRIL
ncbi:hypothetical protein HOY80DRAFT_1011092 [Tuber brumale]|nr:hypothetical protein HOY80DRAFT_1011092 [Tuber brumale]